MNFLRNIGLILLFASSIAFAKPPILFELERLDSSESFKLSNYIGKKTIIINFFASWCTSCITEIPELNALKKKYVGNQYLFIAINAGERSKVVKKFLKKYPFDFEILLDTKREVAKSYGITELPRTLIISKQGKIIFNENRPPTSLH